MTKPALLDSVIIRPVVERRVYNLPEKNSIVYLCHNTSDETGRVDKTAFPSWPPKQQMVVGALGERVGLASASEPRRRKEYITFPEGSTAILYFDHQKAKLQ